MESDEYWERFKRLLQRPSFIIKPFELALAIASTVILQDSVLYGTSLYMAQLVCMVYPGFILITLVNMIGMILGEIPKSLVMMWAVSGGILWMTAGIILIESHYYIESIFMPKGLRKTGMKITLDEEMERKLAAGVLGFTNGVAHWIEFAFVIKLDTEE